MIFAIWLLVLGVLGASNLIIAKRPDAEQYIQKLAPYQGWLGAVSALWGVWTLVTAILNLGWLGKGFALMIWWVTLTAIGLVLTGLGLLLGVGVMKTFVKDETAVAKLDQTVAKLAPKQGLLGLIAIGLGVWGILARIIW